MTENVRYLRAGEIIPYTWDFADRLGGSETLSTPTITVDPTPSPAELTVSGTAVDSPATTVSFKADASDAVVGKRYRLNLSVTTTAGNTLEETLVVAIGI